ncbi:interferon-induced very large GTPase 1-like [Neolamprologus brichardi]|uniref:interferon-induced very large GTPase 1-like n=1 Tax=Neolamprologus brichardi TaxID=32507 RepID=UPI001643EA4A|nr:interferon-induced very large GTPase 1-like [Neolamprologus brichardi]
MVTEITKFFISTGRHLVSVLEDLNLERYYREKQSRSKLLEIDEQMIKDEPAKYKSDLPWYFLKELMMVNVTARNRIKLNDQSLITDMPNPLDIITALFLCSDGFVQQEMALKMSMCQFSVPLLLPNCDTNQCTLMLWAMRDIVKKYRPQSLSESKGFIEDRIVLSELPMISFVRLGECSLSKSEILNKLLSNSQQYHDTFVHRNMECGDSPRAISNGLTEITWYLPCGNTNIDIFSQPVAVANLHGDIESFETQYSFLCQTSAAVFVFFGDLDESEHSLLTNINQKTQIFLVGNGESNNEVLRTVANKLGLSNNNIITKKKQKNDADFVQTLRKKVRDVVKNSKIKMTIEQMADIAYKLGILVDEDSPECQNAKTNADVITAEIQDIHRFKEDQLPRQGEIWKELTCLEKEEFRLQHIGSRNIEDYRSELLLQKKELRKKQNSYNMSTAMTCFINAISSQGTERFYFLKWMQMNLDNLSRTKLSELQEKYKEKCKNSENKEEIKEIDRQISNSSLGTEHFFREMGQIYEASLSLPQTDPSRQQLQHLPKLCAELLLDGFPLELVDGDASNIPLRWVTDVLSQLSDLVSPNRKILVVTVLGVQGTGKSTLLNTMFGVQFAVSSGRCTRGAFMSLIKIDEDMKKVLNCDFMLIIDTEGLKSPELAQLDNSYAAAKMEKKEENKSFTDVMEYSPDTGNWYIPGLWNGNPPMAPVSVGYSEAVYELKKHIIQLLGNCESSAKDILDFKEWMSNLWNAVKHESFIFSFRNNLVADLYMRLCTEFNKWEWEFKKEMYTFVTNAERRISNFGKVAVKSESSDINEFLKRLKIEASTVLSTWETRLLENLRQYFKKTDGHGYLVEGYKEEFSSNAKSLRREMERTVFNQLTAAAEITQEMIEIDRIKENHIKEIENAVWGLINECWKNNAPMGETELENKFLKMWCETLKKLPCSEKQAKQIFTNAASYLRESLKHKGDVSLELLEKKLEDCGLVPFRYTAERYSNRVEEVDMFFDIQDYIMAAQKLADSIIDVCTQFVREKVRRKKMYCDTYIKEILHITDENLEKNQEVKADIMFEVFLKQHVCGIAAREFKKVHEENDPYRCLIKNKDRFCDDFKHVVNKEDQCQKKAEEFTNQCLKPAVQDFINQSLGPKIIDEMLTCEQFSTRMSFQCSILLDLLSKEDFKNYQRYIFSYQDYVKTWILNQIVEHFSTISEFEDRHLQSCIRSINDAINKAKTGKSDNVKTFVEDICKELGDKLVISKDALGAFMFLNNADKNQFADWLTVFVNEMYQDLRKEFQTLNFEVKLQQLHVHPENELFNKLVGCGKQCPFCKVVCDAGGGGHTEHFALLHRPQGLGRYTWHVTKKLVTNICSSSVISEQCFSCIDTNGRWHPYKKYKEIYPDWKIPPDSSLEASDYWKYVMAKYNMDLAKEYNANPADIPESWNDITKEQAEKSLKKSFNIK